jgi:hypothetical protein
MTVEHLCLQCGKPIKQTKVKVKTVCNGHDEPWLSDADIALA